jgi:anti-anti-sigma factor
MVEEIVSRLRSVREFSIRPIFWSGLLGLAAGVFWTLSQTGPYRWLADWERTTLGIQAPLLIGVQVILLTLLLSLFVGYCLFTYVFGSVRYELPLPCTVRTLPEHDITVVQFSALEPPEAERDKTIVRVPDEQFVCLIDEKNPATQNWRRVLVDLDKIDFLNLKALGKLIEFQKAQSRRGRSMVLSGLKPEILQVFKITKLDTLFTLCQDEEEALRLFEGM